MLKVDSKKFDKEMRNLVDYSLGFLSGVESGKKKFLENLGKSTIEGMKEFIDSMARVDKEMLHHVYEWNKTGSPDARLFDIDYTISNLGLSIKSTFRQSQSIKDGSTVPFYDKARIMEEGIPVVIKPRKASVLSFDDNGEQIFTKNPVKIESPGGEATTGGFEQVFDMFMSQYFTQAFLSSSGILDKLRDISIYKKNIRSGVRSGKTKGKEIGYRWITNAGVIN